MKDIIGHKSWNMEEIIGILCKTGTYTCPNLPHYRYDRVKTVCIQLRKRGFIKKTGHTNVSINYAVTDRFKEWKTENESGVTALMPIKWQKAKYPLPDKKKKEPKQ